MVGTAAAKPRSANREEFGAEAKTQPLDSESGEPRLRSNAAVHLVETFGLEGIYDQLAEPQFKSIVEEAVWFCWSSGRANYSPTQDRRRFMQGYIAGRIQTATLLDEAWRACQEAEKDELRSGLLKQINEQEQVSPDLDSLSDEEIGYLYHGTLRRVAEQARHR